MKNTISEKKFIQSLSLDMIVNYVKNMKITAHEQSWGYELGGYRMILFKYGNSYLCSSPEKI